jgi:hypothetical protein
MRPAFAGDLLGLLLDFATGTLTLFINGERCGVVWDNLCDKKLNFCVELNGLETSPPPQVRMLPPPRLPREKPRPLRTEEPPPAQVKEERHAKVKTTGSGPDGAGGSGAQDAGTSTMVFDPNPRATTANYPLAQATGGRATANPSRMAQVAQIFRRFDGDRDRYLNFTELAALEWEVSRQELSPANYVALCEAVGADQPEKGLDEQCLHRFYEMAGESELEVAYEKLFKAASNWLSPLAEWAVRDARAVGGLPRIYLSSQPESAYVPEPQKEENIHAENEDWEEPEPKAREVWTQTGEETALFEPLFISNRSFYQGRLGTNIGKAPTHSEPFSFWQDLGRPCRVRSCAMARRNAPRMAIATPRSPLATAGTNRAARHRRARRQTRATLQPPAPRGCRARRTRGSSGRACRARLRRGVWCRGGRRWMRESTGSARRCEKRISF